MIARAASRLRMKALPCAALLAALLAVGAPASAQDPNPCRTKSAAEFARLIEQNDFWRGSITGADGRGEGPDLERIRWRAPALQGLASYNRYHFDYGRARRTSDPMHRFTLLALVFSDEAEIPFASGALLQAYPPASQADESTPAFPLEAFAELVHAPVRWERREYIEWQALRCGETVYVLYTIPTTWAGEIQDHAKRLRSYLEIDSDETMNDFLISLLAHRAQARIDYDLVAELQVLLAGCGFDPGPPDGIWGTRTEAALGELLRAAGIAEPGAKLDSLAEISELLWQFQSERGLLRTGRCDAMTLRRLARLCEDGRVAAPR